MGAAPNSAGRPVEHANGEGYCSFSWPAVAGPGIAWLLKTVHFKARKAISETDRVILHRTSSVRGNINIMHLKELYVIVKFLNI